MSENVRDNDPKGVGPFMWAALEMERLGYTVENLFNEEVVDGIAEKEILKSDETAAFYNLAGVRVGKNYRGIKIKNGRVMR